MDLCSLESFICYSPVTVNTIINSTTCPAESRILPRFQGECCRLYTSPQIGLSGLIQAVITWSRWWILFGWQAEVKAEQSSLCPLTKILCVCVCTRKAPQSSPGHQKKIWSSEPIALLFLAATTNHWEKEQASPIIQLHNSITTSHTTDKHTHHLQ